MGKRLSNAFGTVGAISRVDRQTLAQQKSQLRQSSGAHASNLRVFGPGGIPAVKLRVPPQTQQPRKRT